MTRQESTLEEYDGQRASIGRVVHVMLDDSLADKIKDFSARTVCQIYSQDTNVDGHPIHLYQKGEIVAGTIVDIQYAPQPTPPEKVRIDVKLCTLFGPIIWQYCPYGIVDGGTVPGWHWPPRV